MRTTGQRVVDDTVITLSCAVALLIGALRCLLSARRGATTRESMNSCAAWVVGLATANVILLIHAHGHNVAELFSLVTAVLLIAALQVWARSLRMEARRVQKQVDDGHNDHTT
jgi:hypothetical protein